MGRQKGWLCFNLAETYAWQRQQRATAITSVLLYVSVAKVGEVDWEQVRYIEYRFETFRVVFVLRRSNQISQCRLGLERSSDTASSLKACYG